MERKLASIRTVASLRPIKKADNIEVATIDGWDVVVKKGDFNVGDKCVFFEIDSFLPYDDERFAFLQKIGVRTFEGKKGMRLKTIRLRGQLSQGLVLKTELFDVEIKKILATLNNDLTEAIGVLKYETPIPMHLRGQVVGKLPWQIKRTDQERLQNIVNLVADEVTSKSQYEVSIKLDGVSCTFFKMGDHIGVASRTMEYKDNEENNGNVFVKVFRSLNIRELFSKVEGDFAIQGEIMGPGIRGNREELGTLTFFAFDVWDVKQMHYVCPEERQRFLTHHFPLIRHVPVVFSNVELSNLCSHENVLRDLLAQAEGPSLYNKTREGLVFKRTDGFFSFKVISNTYLENEKDE